MMLGAEKSEETASLVYFVAAAATAAHDAEKGCRPQRGVGVGTTYAPLLDHDLPPQELGLFCNSYCDCLQSTLSLLAEDDIAAQVYRSTWLLLTRRGSRELGIQSNYTREPWAP